MEEALELLGKYLDATKLKYLADLVDLDTSGNQDDEFYLILMEAYDIVACEEDQ